MITPLSAFVWNVFPILNTAQFSTRLMLILAFSISTLITYLTVRYKKFPILIAIFLVITIGYTILNWGQRRVIPQINDAALKDNLPLSTSQGEGWADMGEPKWILPNTKFESIIPKQHLQIIQGKGLVREIKRTNTRHEYISSSSSTMILKENTWYFPGWNLTIDGKLNPINYTNKKYPGIITFFVPAGLHKISVIYSDLFILTFAKIISILSLFFSLLFITVMWLKSLVVNKKTD